MNTIEFAQALETAHGWVGALRTAATEEEPPDLTPTSSRLLPLLVGITSLKITVHHSLVIVEIHNIEK